MASLRNLSIKERDVESLLKTLADIPLFSRCSEHHLQRLVRHMKEMIFKPKSFIMKEGESGKRFYIIIDGMCDVIINNLSVGKLSSGDYCGELALIESGNGKRSATIQCINRCRAFWIDKATFKRVLQNDMKIIFHNRRENVKIDKKLNAKQLEDNARKSVVNSNDINNVHLIHPSKSEIKWLLQAVQTNVLFRQLTLNERRYVISRMHLQDVKKGDKIITEGEDGDNFYIIRSGRFKVYQSSKGLLRYVTTRDCVGELALIYNSKRSASVQAVTMGKVWTIDRLTLRYHVKELNKTKTNEIISFLKKISLFKTLVSYEFLKISDGFEEKEYDYDHKIISTGELGDKFFIIKEGTADVFINESQLETNIPHRKLRKGDYFGERSLLKNEPVSATIISSSKNMSCYVMTKSKFEQLLGPLQDIMNRHMKDFYNNSTAASSSKRKSSVSSSSSSASVGKVSSGSKVVQKKRISKVRNVSSTKDNINRSEGIDMKIMTPLEKLIHLGRIGVGGYGIVNLVRDPSSSKVLALKCVRKDLIVWNKQQKQIQSELNVMKLLNNSFVVNLWRTYKDNYKIYFLIDVAMGGDLFHYMRIAPSFNEKQVKFYTACVIEALSHVHSKNIVYRDLKPENLVICSNGYLKLTDMGLAKILKSSGDKTYTMCGTPDYLSPEIILGRGHNQSTDWWGLGILIYELIAKVPPFMGRPDRIADKILSSKPKFSYLFSMQVQDLISKLLIKNPNERLHKSDKIKSHHWFNDLDWKKLRNQKLKSPYKPSLNSDEDLTNFKMSLQPDPSEPSPIVNAKWDQVF